MEKTDFRTISEEARHRVRVSAIQLIASGKKGYEVAQMLGVRTATVSAWVKQHRLEGRDGLRAKHKGMDPEKKKLLSAAQEEAVQKMLIDTMPDQLKLNFALWTRKAVKELVERELNIVLAINTMGDYLRKWGFTPQKPKKKAYEQRPAEVEQWLVERYPAIRSQAKAEGAEIHWGDETGVRNACHHGRSYSPKGRTPVKKSMAKRFSVNMISTVTNQGKVRFMVYTDTMNSERLIDFMERLIKDSPKKILLILDNLKVHHSRPVKQWVEANRERIELFHLPSYSPEKNPDEYLNCDLKEGMSQRPSPKTPEKLRENVEDHMNMLSGRPERVMRYFLHNDIKYAA